MTEVGLGPATVNLTGIVQNDSWSLAFTLTAGGLPYDLTGATIVAKLVLADTTKINLGISVTDAAAGEMTVSCTAAPLIDGDAQWALRVNARTMMSGYADGIADILD